MGVGPTNRGGSSKTYISTATTTAVKASTGVLRRIVLGETAAGAITINDNLGTVAVLKASIVEGTYEFDVTCVGKIEVVTAAGSKLTVVFD
jgi:hypothetical protein